jgi:nucleotide-binding universal stress UspA family protein
MATKHTADKPGTTLIAGYDGSESAAVAVRWAAARAAADGGRLIVVCADHPGLPRPAATARNARAKAGLDALWMVEDALIDTDVDLVVADAAPATALCRAAADAHADGIVVGRHHAGPFNADTVHQLLQVTDRPVTVVPS